MTDNGRTTDGRTPDHDHPISSPCEPNGSGELKIGREYLSFFTQIIFPKLLKCIEKNQNFLLYHITSCQS